MKPSNWNKLSEKEKKEIALNLLKSQRGAYIMGQALYTAIEVMKQVPKSFREVSNIEDMEMLEEALFPIYRLTQTVPIPKSQQSVYLRLDADLWAKIKKYTEKLDIQPNVLIEMLLDEVLKNPEEYKAKLLAYRLKHNF